jgi:CheY-like chemotaxis protein
VVPYQPGSILLVEDDKTACEIISSMLTVKFPHALFNCVGNGKAGLDSFRRCLPDIVITDINMPELDGFQMLESIIAIKPDAHIIVVTAYSSNNFLEKITSTGVNVRVVTKPIDFKTLFASIERRAALPPDRPGPAAVMNLSS